MIHGTDIKGYQNNDYIIVDGVVASRDKLADLLKGDRFEVYEVLRVKNGKPLLPEAHYKRFTLSLESEGRTPAVSREEFFRQINELVRLCGVHDQNMRIDQFVDSESGKERLFVYLVPTSFPTAEQFRDGVDVGYMEGERKGPTAKIYDRQLRERADAVLRETGFYEAILVDRNGNVTENSRSNLFFIKDGAVISSMADTILPGLTRLKVMRHLAEHGVPYIEQTISATQLGQFDAAFLTATSPDVLPIARAVAAEGQPYPTVSFDVSNQLLRDLMAWFAECDE